MSSFNIKSAIPHVTAIVIFLIITAFYFSPQLEGKVMKQGDIIHYKAASKEIKDFKEKTGHHSLWTNSMFSGMPSYQISIDRSKNMLHYLSQSIRFGIRGPIGLFFVMMICSYLLFILLGVSPWISILGALAMGFSTNNFVLFEAGHNTKLATLSYTGLILVGMILTYRNRMIVGGILFTSGLALSIYSNHPQMTYYLTLVCVIYLILKLIESIKEKTLLSFSKQSLILVLGAILAIGASFSQIWTSLDYKSDTMRGDPIIVKNNASNSSSSDVKGLDWNYAMQWSNGLLDQFAILIPGVVGGGSQEPIKKNSAFNTALRKRGAKKMDAAPLYWGSLPFTSGPSYLGAIMILFFVLGLFLEKSKLKWWLGLGVLLTLLLAMGKNFELFNRLLFNTLPMFNNFRTPNSVLSVTAFLLPILSIVTLSKIINKKYDKSDVLKALKWSIGIVGGIALFFAVIGPSIFSFEGVNDLQLKNAKILDATILDRQSLMRSDSFRTLMLIIISGGLIWAYILDKMKEVPLVIGLFALIAFDYIGVGKRYVNNDDFVSASKYNQTFKPRSADQQILKDQDLHFRVHDISINTFNSASSSFYHKTIGGYSAAKLQRYQDLIDYHISTGNQSVLNMLNMKYLISRDQTVQRNPNALGNAWFVSQVQYVNTPKEEIESLTNFNPTLNTFVNKEFSNTIGTQVNFTPNGRIDLTKYTPDEMTYHSNSTSNQMVVFSEIWYGPNKGWKAFVDGKETEIFRANYILRAIKIPAGEHTITMKFEPKMYYMGQNISFVISFLIVLSVIFLVLVYLTPMGSKLKFLKD